MFWLEPTVNGKKNHNEFTESNQQMRDKSQKKKKKKSVVVCLLLSWLTPKTTKVRSGAKTVRTTAVFAQFLQQIMLEMVSSRRSCALIYIWWAYPCNPD
jgi:hypothetical protein